MVRTFWHLHDDGVALPVGGFATVERDPQTPAAHLDLVHLQRLESVLTLVEVDVNLVALLTRAYIEPDDPAVPAKECPHFFVAHAGCDVTDKHWEGKQQALVW